MRLIAAVMKLILLSLVFPITNIHMLVFWTLTGIPFYIPSLDMADDIALHDERGIAGLPRLILSHLHSETT
jgi:hypothetical protein